MLRTVPKDFKSQWKYHCHKVVHAYNCSRHDTTGFSPFYLLFGRNPWLPIDLTFRFENDESTFYEVKKKTEPGEIFSCNATVYHKKVQVRTELTKRKPITGKHKIYNHTHNDVCEKDSDNSNDLTYKVRSTNIYSKLPIDGIHVDNGIGNDPYAVSDDESEIIIPNNIENVTSKDKPTRLRHHATRFTYDRKAKHTSF